MSDLAFLPALEQAALVRERRLSSLELVTEYLRRIERLNQSLRALVTVASDQALAAARTADQAIASGRPSAPFLGVPIAIKDVTDAAGLRTTFSSKAFATHEPAQDASVVRGLREAGFIVIGKTNVPEFALFGDTVSELNGACRNPWDLARSPGGSSGGSAAAVASGLCPAAHGTDGGGSVRAPASCCGVFGLKPSRGRISSGPLAGDVLNGLVTDGVIARSVRDAAAILDAAAGYQPGDPYWAPNPDQTFLAAVDHLPARRLRVGVVSQAPNGAPVSRDCLSAVAHAADLLRSLGHTLVAEQPAWRDNGQALCRVGPAVMAYVDTAKAAQFEPRTRALLRAAEGVTSIDYVRSVVSLQRDARDFVRFWAANDLLLTPTLAAPPVPSGWLFGEDDDIGSETGREEAFSPFTAMANVTGQPAASLPLWWNDDGVPVGVQLIGAPAADARLLAVAGQLEQAQPWAWRRPPAS